MPDPRLYVIALAAACGSSALVVLARGCLRRPASDARTSAAEVLAVGVGLAVGFYLLRLWPAWPPTTALGRMVAVVLPAVIGVELLAVTPRVPMWLAWLSRSTLALATGRVLLHGSVYLNGRHSPWTAWQASLALLAAGGLLLGVWSLIAWLQARSPSAGTPLALAQTHLAAGLCVMLAGYVSGGEAALPFAAALAGATAALARCPPVALRGAIGIGVVGLFSLLFIGRFFGGLSATQALTIFLAPLLCWATELPRLRPQSSWLAAVLRLVLVAAPLLAVLVLAKRDFDRGSAALLSAGRGTSRAIHPIRVPTPPPANAETARRRSPGRRFETSRGR